MLGKALLVCLRLYLDCFAFFAPNFEHARFEHSLIEASFRERFRDLRQGGAGSTGAVAKTLRAHAAEIAPIALCRKTLADARTAPRQPGEASRHALRVGAMTAVLLVAVFLAVRGLAEHGDAVVGVGLASGNEEGAVTHLGEYDTLRAAIYHTIGVCISSSVTTEELDDELLSQGSPGADCSDLRAGGGPDESRAGP